MCGTDRVMLTVVIGPPAAGKSTWVLQRAKPTDIVIDYDRIAVALAGLGADTHDHTPAIAAVTKAARTAAIEAAVRQAEATDVWLIHSSPGQRRLDQYRALGADIVTIDPGRDVVRDRCKHERPAKMFAVIDAWYRDKAADNGPDNSRGRIKLGGGSDPRGTQAWKNLRAQVFAEETHCWQCGQWVDQDLPRTHSLSRSVDHLDPIGRGYPGVPDRSRVRLAHRSCNARRGHRPERAEQRQVTISIDSI